MTLADLEARWKALPYSGCSKTFVLGEFQPSTVFLCVGEALGENEEKLKRPFVGDSGQRLRDSLKKAGVDLNSVSYCNLLPRRPTGNRTPTRQEIKANKDFLFELIRLVDPAIVLLLGNVPLEALTGRKKITAERGREFHREDFGDMLFLPTFHPASTMYRPSGRPAFESDLRWALRLAKGNILDAGTLPDFPFLTEASQLASFLSRIQQAPYVYFDIEAGAIPPARAIWHWDERTRPILVSFGWMEKAAQACVVEWNDQTDALLKEFFARPFNWTGQNVLQYDLPLLETHGVQLTTRPDDTYLMARLLNENETGGLKQRLRDTLALTNHTPYRTETEEEHFHSRWHLWSEMDATEKAIRIRYSALDAWGGIQDWILLKQQFDRRPKLQRLYHQVLIPACAAATEMERTGLPVNIRKLWCLARDTQREVRRTMRAILDNLPPDAWEIVNPPKSKRKIGSNKLINPGSTHQLGRILFKVFKLPPVKMTDAGLETTNEDALLKLLDLKGDLRYDPTAFVVLEAALQMREKRQLLNMFMRPFMKQIKAQNPNWRQQQITYLHGRFHVAATDTLRLASNSPNMQNIGRAIRHIFEAPPGHVFINADESGLEMRGAADLSGDPTLRRLIRQGSDVHWYNTCQFLGWSIETPYDEKQHKPLRYCVKTLGFASLYSAREKKIAETIRKKFRDAGVGVELVRDILRRKNVEGEKDPFVTLAKVWREWMFGHYKFLTDWHERVRAEVTRKGEITSWFGWTRHLPDALANDFKAREEAVRMAINCVPQNLALLTLTALRDLREIRNGSADWKSIAQVHDSITLLCREDVAPTWALIVQDVMEDSGVFREFDSTFSVPLVAEVRISPTWA